MRLKNMFFTCKDLIFQLNGIKVETTESRVGPDNVKFYVIDEWVALKPSLLRGAEIFALKQMIAEVISLCELRRSTEEKIMFNTSEYRNFVKAVDNLKIAVTTIIDLCYSLHYEDFDSDRVGFDIKLPDDLDFADYADCFKDINFIINQYPYIRNQESNINFKTVDIGTTWLDFFIFGSAAIATLTALAVLIDKALIIRSHKLTANQQLEKVKQMQTDEKLIAEIEKSYSIGLEAVTKSVVTELEKDYGELEPEDKERAEKSLDRLSYWLTKGLEIHNSIDSKEEIKALFPPLERQRLTENEIKLLASGKSEK